MNKFNGHAEFGLSPYPCRSRKAAMQQCADHFAGITRQGYYRDMYGNQVGLEQAAAMYGVERVATRLRKRTIAKSTKPYHHV